MRPEESAAWKQAQTAFAHAAPNRSVATAKNSGHIVMTDRPDLVSDTVVAAFDQARETQRR